MKKLCLFILGLAALTAQLVRGQNRLIQEDRIWEYFNYEGDHTWYEQFCFDGTQEIGGKTYHQWKLIKKISLTTDPDTEVAEIPEDKVTALLREEGGRVYMLLSGESVRDYNSETQILSTPLLAPDGKESILYDFTISEGESFSGIVKILWAEEWNDPTQTALSDCRVMETGTVALADSEVRKFTIQAGVDVALVRSLGKIDLNDPDMLNSEMKLDGEEDDSDGNLDSQSLLTYAEVLGNIGRGDMTSLTPASALFLTSGMMDYHVSYLRRVYDTDGTVIYGVPSGVTSAGSGLAEKEDKTYDLHGHVVTATVPGSIYIRDGRKFVAK